MFTKRHNVSSPEFSQNAHQIFAQLRQDAPLIEAKLSSYQRCFLVSRYDDCVEVLKSPRFIKDLNNAKTDKGRSAVMWMPANFRPLLNNMLNTDDPEHRRLRNLVHKAFTPKMIQSLEVRIQTITDDLLDRMSQKKTFELVQDFALPLPVSVISEMMGVPVQDQPMFSEMTRRIVADFTPWNMIKAIPSVSRFMNYIRQLADQRRQDPQDDLLSGLVQAEDEGERLNEEEMLAMVFLLLVAGHETTVNLITMGMFSLLRHPDQLADLRQNPGIIDTAIEELLRYDGPLQTAEMTFARETFEWHGMTIPKGKLVMPALLSANRDETVFENPDQLDLRRDPNRHLAFGMGIHYCLGAPLARLEARIAFCSLLERFPDLRLAVPAEEVEYKSVLILRRIPKLKLAG
jgi:cytochrome P450 PksS